jgi:cytosine deaminase
VFLGVDLAWAEKNRTGLAAVAEDGELLDLAEVRSDAEILDWLGPWTRNDCLVAIDAPIIVNNPTGSRSCEAALGRVFARYDAGAHPANTGKPEFAHGSRAQRLADALDLDTDPRSTAPRRAIEVYPHPATVSLFGLEKTIKYKHKQGRELSSLRVALLQLMHLVEGLETSEIPLRVRAHPRWREIRAGVEGATRKVDLKLVEDVIDAVLCAYVGLYSLRRPELTHTFGDGTTGYIVTPVTPEMRNEITRSQQMTRTTEPVAHDLVITNATLRGRRGSHSIGIRGAQISTISLEPLDGTQVIDAAGRLVTESFVNAHMHLDKVYTLDRVGQRALAEYTGSGMAGAMTSIELASAVKREYDESWLAPNVRRAVEAAVIHGVRHVLAFADVDTTAGLRGIRPVLAARDELAAVVNLQVVAFPQDGLLRDPGAEDLVREAVDLGADVVGGIPWIELSDADALEHVRRMCELAAERGLRVAMLVDDAGDPALRTTEMLAAEMIRTGLVGRGVANHARAIGLYAEPSVRRVIALARQAGLGFVSDPHTGPLRLPVLEFLDAGIPVALGQDDIEDAYYPFGRHNMLEVAFLAAHIMSAVSDEALERLYDSITTTAARVMGIEGHELRSGGNADLVVLDGRTVREVLTRHSAPRYVVHGGRLVAETETSSRLLPPTG